MEEPSDTADPLSILLIIQDFFEGPLFQYLTQSLLIILLLLLTGFLSSLELAYDSLTSENINSLKNSKDFGDRRINYLNLNHKQALTSLGVFKNVLTVSVVALSSFFIWENSAQSFNPSTVLFFFIASLSVVFVFVNEVVPKLLVKGKYFNYSKKTSLVFFIIFKIFQPFYRLLNKATSKKHKKVVASENGVLIETFVSDEDENSEENEDGEDEDMHVNFEYTTIKQIMVNRLDIMAFDYNLSFEDLLKEVNAHGFSRIPVYKETIDSIEGILYVKDLLIHLEKKEEFNWHNLIRPGFFVPESKKVEDLLKEFQEKKVHMAIVVDEYGGTAGLVTLEDIIEEIVGEINDEFDKNDASNFSKLDETTYVFEGMTSLEEFEKIYNIETKSFTNLPGENEDLGDFLLNLFGRMPSIGEQITFNQFEFTVISVDKEKINRVKVFIKEQSDKEGHLVGR